MTKQVTMRVGRAKKESPMKQKMIRMTQEIIEQIETKAGRRKFSAWVRAAVEKKIEEEK